jgi:transcriptional regulator with XRE-family HTH domain
MKRMHRIVPIAPGVAPLKVYRVAAGMTQRELAKTSGVAQRTIANIETAESKPHRATVRALEQALGLDIGYALFMQGREGGHREISH